MERITYKDAFGINIRQDFDSVDEELVVMAMALFAREEMEEKREQGCDFCNGKIAYEIGEVEFDCYVIEETGETQVLMTNNCSDSVMEITVVMEYCPFCGRKLVK